MLDFTLILLFSFILPLAIPWQAVRHGPIENRWWKGETVIGFTCFVGGIAFLAGLVAPLLLFPEANQGPLLGIFYTGPIGFSVGFVLAVVRAFLQK